jgi:predicted dehydrogenase
MVRLAVVGTGAWGINHVRAFARAKGVQLVAVCDAADENLGRARQIAPDARATRQLGDVLGASDVDAVVLATPAKLHAEQAVAALDAGKHVLVEKPLALSGRDADAVVAAARRSGKTAMVGHLMLYHPAVERMKQMLADGALGDLLYMYALRVNLGRVRRDENAMWSLAPHDISMMAFLTGQMPQSVSARGGCYLQKNVEDVAFLNMRFPSGALGQVQLSWLDPRKERRLTIVGSQKMVEFDDAHPMEKLRIYDKGFDKPPSFTEYAEFMQIRNGDILIPRISMAEPLELEAKHFIECVTSGKRPLSDVESGSLVVRVLEAASMSLRADGAPVLIQSI